MSNTFFYFAYGSNLLSKRIRINNPSARRVGIGKLADHRLDFITYSTRWKGASATIVPHKEHYVWGAIWEISNNDMPHLDRQEGVHVNIYKPLHVQVQLLNESFLECRVYMQTIIPDYVEYIEHLPFERFPSGIYITTILKGAEECNLPEKYVKFLKRVPKNDYFGNAELKLELDIID
ncbi:gamma-glutamylcyclotransferase-like [Agrilus planipennis]|uniref:gamma-glutamylcyclotransferase n=1 Tax=Agrilus planipennis TaxID=224129 RepID=A0A1W4WF99_AGRPL|nr:gamma-glutamylcyclotransferase-like [Agrilus planipennis]